MRDCGSTFEVLRVRDAGQGPATSREEGLTPVRQVSTEGYRPAIVHVGGQVEVADEGVGVGDGRQCPVCLGPVDGLATRLQDRHQGDLPVIVNRLAHRERAIHTARARVRDGGKRVRKQHAVLEGFEG